LKFRTEAKPFLTDLAQRAKETVYLVVLDQNEILYVDKVEPDEYPSGLAMVSKVGTRMPAHACAVGKVLLSQLTQDRLDQLIKDKGLPKRTDKTITDPARLKEHLFSVRNQGYAVDDEENERGIRCVAAPVRDEEGRVIAAISVSGPTIRLTKKTIQDTFRYEVVATALKISQQLGFKD
jgi:IclR family KDG regulon transcriptional repressor